MGEITSGKYVKTLCECCGERKTANFFYSNYGNQYDRKFARYCKVCCADRIAHYKETMSEKAALWMVLSELGIPFINKVYDDLMIQRFTQSSGPKPEIVGHYIKRISKYSVVYNGFWDTNVSIKEILEQDIKEDSDEKRNLDLMIETWGKYPPDEYVEAYEFLEKTFRDYTQDFPEMDANLTNRYRDLCKAEYRKRKADESGDVGEIKQAQANLTDLLKLLKLNDFQSNQKSEMEKMIERKIWMIENTRPAECEDLEAYKDVSGFEPVWDDILRCVRNLVAGTRDYPDLPKDVSG